MEYFVASSYKDCERISQPYNKEGKLYTKIKVKCPRCNGLGIIVARVENDRMIPIPVDGGICYKCNGGKYFTKEVRLYTKKEFETMEKNKERARIRRQEELKAKMEAEYEHKKAVWLETHGFAEDGSSYIITGETYSIKDELKEAGFRFDPVLLWHRASIEGYEDRAIKIKVDDFFEFSAWGDGHYKIGAKEKIQALLAENEDYSHSEWVGEIGDHIKNEKVTLKRKGSFSGRYGLTNVYTFENEIGSIYTWFTSTFLNKEIDETFYIKGTIKKHDEYKGVKTTVLTRVKVEGAA